MPTFEQLLAENAQLKAEKAALVARVEDLTDRHTAAIIGGAHLDFVKNEAGRMVAKESRDLREIADPIASAIPDSNAALRVASLLRFAATSLENAAKLLGVDPREGMAPPPADAPDAEVIVLSERIARSRPATIFELVRPADAKQE